MRPALRYYYYRGGEEASLPTDISGLKFWYDISQLTGLVDGDQIATLTDYSGNNLSISQATTGRRGIYKTNVLNGKPSLRNSGTALAYQSATKTDWDWMHQGNNTLFLVWRISVDNATITLFDSAGGNLTSLIGRDIKASNLAKITDECYAAGAAAEYVFSAGGANSSFPKDVFVITVHRYEQGKTGNDFTLDKNNVSYATNQGVLSPSASTSDQLPAWFARATLLNTNFQGDFCEGFGYNRALTTDEIAAQYATLSLKYAI